jgi:hypothetical protein
MKKKITMSFRTFGKIGFLLVVIGFFMPIACDQNGFQIANALNKGNETLSAILLYVLFAAAVAGVLVGVLLLLKNKIKVSIDWLCLLACIGSGLALYLPRLDDDINRILETGAYVILAGWIIALAAQIISKVNREA